MVLNVLASSTYLKLLQSAPPSEAPRFTALFNRARLREDIVACTACDLHSDSSQRVPWQGGPSAVAFVGEAPGRSEDQAGVPFVGRAGRLLDDTLAGVNLPRSSVTVMNTICCRPWRNDFARAVQADAPHRCRPFLYRQLDMSEAWLVVSLGLRATYAFHASDMSMSKLRGKWWWRDGRLHTATWHPAYVLRSPDVLVQFTDDLRTVAEVLANSSLPIRAELPVELVGRLRGAPSHQHVKAFTKLGWLPLYSHLFGEQVVLVADPAIVVPAPYDAQPRYTVRELAALRPLVRRGEFGFDDMRRIHALKATLNAEVMQ